MREKDPDEEYDRKVIEDMENADRVIDKRMTMAPQPDLGAHMAETLNLANEAARIHIKLGRQQMALEFSRCASMTEVAALCRREAV